MAKQERTKRAKVGAKFGADLGELETILPPEMRRAVYHDIRDIIARVLVAGSGQRSI